MSEADFTQFPLSVTFFLGKFSVVENNAVYNGPDVNWFAADEIPTMVVGRIEIFD